jgi:hypothetical protein
VSIDPLKTQMKGSQVDNNTVSIYSQTCIERSPVEQGKGGFNRQVIS